MAPSLGEQPYAGEAGRRRVLVLRAEQEEITDAMLRLAMFIGAARAKQIMEEER